MFPIFFTKCFASTITITVVNPIHCAKWLAYISTMRRSASTRRSSPYGGQMWTDCGWSLSLSQRAALLVLTRYVLSLHGCGTLAPAVANQRNYVFWFPFLCNRVFTLLFFFKLFLILLFLRWFYPGYRGIERFMFDKTGYLLCKKWYN